MGWDMFEGVWLPRQRKCVVGGAAVRWTDDLEKAAAAAGYRRHRTGRDGVVSEGSTSNNGCV